MTEAQPNPYNARKDYGNDVVETEFVSSDSLFTPKKPVTEPDGPVDSTDTLIEDDGYKQRYTELQSYTTRRQNEMRQEIEQLKAKATIEQPSYVPPKSAEELEAFRTDSPEMNDIIDSKIHQQTEDMSEKLDALKKRENDLRKREARSDLTRLHSDVDEITNDPAFHNWADNQPEQIQDWIYKNPYDGTLAARAIDLYKQDAGFKTAEVVEENIPDNTDAASLVTTRSAGVNTPSEERIWTRKEINSLTPAQYEQVEAEIDSQHRRGLITQ